MFRTPHGRDGAELLEQFGLTARRRSAFASLSGGERQRLFLVLALLNRPRLVILDELTQGLDPAARRDVWAAIRQLHEAGTTVLLVTHEMDEAEALCDRVLVMRAGHSWYSGRAGGAGGPARRRGDDPVQPARSASRLAGLLEPLDGVPRSTAPGRESWCAATGASSRTSAPP